LSYFDSCALHCYRKIHKYYIAHFYVPYFSVVASLKLANER